MHETDQWIRLYQKYDVELRQLCRALRAQYHIMQARGFHAGFGDVEGELLYLLVREIQPELVFEISPDAGWSTNYILGALTANGHGTLHSFELATTINGRPTEQVIRGNQWDQWNQRQLFVHVGDARRTVGSVSGRIDVLFLDSCHEDWFAKWYVNEVFPRVAGAIVIHDVAFSDQLEPSTEAAYVWKWLSDCGVPVGLAGVIEERVGEHEARQGLAERRRKRSNAVLFHWPVTTPGVAGTGRLSSQGRQERWQLPVAAADVKENDARWNQIVDRMLRTPDYANRHRIFIQAGIAYAASGDRGESARCFQRAIGVALQEDPADRAKSLSELKEAFFRQRQWRFFIEVVLLSALDPGIRKFVPRRFG